MIHKVFLWIAFFALISLQFVTAQDSGSQANEDGDSDVDVSHVAVGNFLSAGAVYAQNLAFYNTSTNKFDAPIGLPSEYTSVSAMAASSDGTLYVAAEFNGGTNILRRSSSGQWVAVGNTLFGTVTDMLMTDSKLYCVGSFTSGDVQNCVSRDMENDAPTTRWSQVGDDPVPSFSSIFSIDAGLIGHVGTGLYILDGDDWNLIPESSGTSAFKVKTQGDRIYIYGPSSMNRLNGNGEQVQGNILSSSDGTAWRQELNTNEAIENLVLDSESKFYYSVVTTDGSLHQVKEGAAETSQGYFLTGNGNTDPLNLYWGGGNLYALGGQGYIADTDTNYARPLAGIARLESEKNFVPVFGGGFSGGNVEQMIVQDNVVYFRGSMSRAYQVFANGMAGYDKKGKRWVDFGDQLNYGESINTVHVTKTGKEASIIVGGDFDRVKGSKLMSIATVNITDKQMSQVGNGLQSYGNLGDDGNPGTVNTIEVIDNNIYAAGKFDRSGSVPLRNFARFNREENTWEDVLGGIDGQVITSNHHGPHIVLGGSFSRAGNLNVANIVRYDVGRDEYVPLGSGIGGTVNHVISDGDHIIACGSFSSAGGRPANNVAIWKSGHWEPLMCGDNNIVCSVNNQCREVRIHNGELYIRTSDEFYRHSDDKLVELSTINSDYDPVSPNKLMVLSPENSNNLWTVGISPSIHFDPHNYIGEFDPDTRNWIHNDMGGFSSSPSTVSGASSVIVFNVMVSIVAIASSVLFTVF